MQITFTAEQLNWVRTGVGTLSTILTIWGLFRQVGVYLKQELNHIITDNVNRGVNETKVYVDAKFTAHTLCDDEVLRRLSHQDDAIAALKVAIEDINKQFRKI